MVNQALPGAGPARARPAPATRSARGRGGWWLAFAVQVVVVLDVTVVYIALPSIGTELRVAAAGLPLAVSAYALPFAAALLLAGRLGDRRGEAQVLGVSGLLFAAASALAGLAPTYALLLAGRAGQGLAAAGASTVALAGLLRLTPDPSRRRAALAGWAAAAAAGGAAGWVLGGAATQTVGWRAVLLAGVPLGLAAALARRALPATPTDPGRHLDLPGAAALGAALLALVAGLEQVAAHPAVGAPLLAVGLGLLAVFALVERRSPGPLLPPALLRGRTACDVRAGNLSVAAVNAATNGPLPLVVLALQVDHRLSPMLTGLAYLPYALATIAGTRAATRLADRLPPQILTGVGLGGTVAGLVVLAVFGTSSLAVVLIALMVIGGSGGLALATATTLSARAPIELAGAAAGVVNTAGILGTGIGAALIGTAVAVTSRTSPVPYLTGAAIALVAVLAAATRRPDPKVSSATLQQQA